MLFFSFSLFFFLLAAALEGWLSSRCCCCRIGCCSGGPLHRRRGFQKQILLPLSSLSLSLSVCLSLSLCFSLRPLFTLYPSGFPDVYVLQPTLAIRNAHLIDWSLTVVKRGDATGESTSTLLFALLRPPRPHTRTHWHTEAHTHTRAATRDLHTYTHNLIPATPSAKALLHKGRETGSQGERKGV